MGLPVVPAGQGRVSLKTNYFQAGNIMSAVFWIGPFFTDLCRYGENGKPLILNGLRGILRVSKGSDSGILCP
ncbi:MAG TPA: hypothetical protein DCZ04_13305 [Syntrophorhabdus aromaticivorans]|nr:hypothetical protein [Syntrophorhabdus aromaticivorans]